MIQNIISNTCYYGRSNTINNLNYIDDIFSASLNMIIGIKNIIIARKQRIKIQYN
jgi:hypothetical protein